MYLGKLFAVIEAIIEVQVLFCCSYASGLSDLDAIISINYRKFYLSEYLKNALWMALGDSRRFPLGIMQTKSMGSDSLGFAIFVC